MQNVIEIIGVVAAVFYLMLAFFEWLFDPKK